METESNFAELVQKAKDGDSDAATTLFNRYSAHIRRAAKTHMVSVRLKRLFDSDDILNSVMKSFFIRLRDPQNQWKLDTPDNLIRLLVTMATNNIASKGRVKGGENESGDVLDLTRGREPSPDEVVAVRELASICWVKLSEDVRSLFNWRYEDKKSWEEIAANLDAEPDACRKRLSRALKEVRDQFPELAVDD